jgi:hypothetical protein
MADSVIHSYNIPQISPVISGNNYEPNRKKCCEYKSQLRETLDELGSARKIIELLQN